MTDQDFAETSHAELERLEKALRPTTLLQRVDALTLNHDRGLVDMTTDGDLSERDCETVSRRRSCYGFALGELLATDESAFAQALPLLFDRNRQNRYDIGRGLGSSGNADLWEKLVAFYSDMEPDKRSAGILCGFLSDPSAAQPEQSQELLDRAVTHPHLGPVFPHLQAAVHLDKKAMARFKHALNLNLAPISEFRILAGGRVCDHVPGWQLRGLLDAIRQKTGGFAVSLDILNMRFFSEGAKSSATDPDLQEFARELLTAWDPDRLAAATTMSWPVLSSAASPVPSMLLRRRSFVQDKASCEDVQTWHNRVTENALFPFQAST